MTNNNNEKNVERVYAMFSLDWGKLHRCHGKHKDDNHCRPSKGKFKCQDTDNTFSCTTMAATNLGGTGDTLVSKSGYIDAPDDLEVGKQRYPLNILTLRRKYLYYQKKNPQIYLSS